MKSLRYFALMVLLFPMLSWSAGWLRLCPPGIQCGNAHVGGGMWLDGAPSASGNGLLFVTLQLAVDEPKSLAVRYTPDVSVKALFESNAPYLAETAGRYIGVGQLYVEEKNILGVTLASQNFYQGIPQNLPNAVGPFLEIGNRLCIAASRSIALSCRNTDGVWELSFPFGSRANFPGTLKRNSLRRSPSGDSIWLLLTELNQENRRNVLLSKRIDLIGSGEVVVVDANARSLESMSEVGKEIFDIAYAANGNDTNPTIYAAARTGVIASEDGGVNWKLTPGLFPGEVRSLVVISRDTLVASSNGRVYISRDAARTWYEFGRGLAAAPKSTANLFYVNNHLVLASQSGWFVCPSLSCDGATTALDGAKVPDRNWDFSGDVGLDTKRQVDVIEYYQSALNHYFVTSDPAEIAYLDKNVATLGWARTGSQFRAWYPQTSAFAVDVCRFYGSVSPGPNSHFYSADSNECQQLHRLEAASAKSVPRWNFEAVAFSVEPVGQDGQCRSGRVPIYRAYNNGNKKGIDSNHRYSARIDELNQLVDKGWLLEGKAFCALP